MSRTARRTEGILAALATAFALTSAPMPALAVESVTRAEALGWSDAPAVAFDVGVLRPLSAVMTVAGVPLFLASAPFAAISGDFLASWDLFVLAPYDYTVRRRLADF